MIAKPLRDLFREGTLGGLPDGQLLERFARRGETTAEAAFAVLVERHGPMVMKVCRALLGDVHEAEDAFQATFLVLARRANSIRDPDLLASWLYGVAHRTARKARGQTRRRRSREVPKGEWTALAADSRAERHDMRLDHEEQLGLVHQELARLPDKERAVVVLCCLEELTVEETANRLHCTTGAVRGRLAQARSRLRSRLARRGVAVGSASVATLLTAHTASATVPPALGTATVQAAMSFVHGTSAFGMAIVSASAARTALIVSRRMFLAQLKLPVAALLALATLGTGLGTWAYRSELDGPGARNVAQPVVVPAEGRVDERGLVSRLQWFVASVDLAGRTLSLSDLPLPQAENVLSIGNAEGTLVPTGMVIERLPVADNAQITLDGRVARLDALQPRMRIAVELAPGQMTVSALRAESGERNTSASIDRLDAVDWNARTIGVSLGKSRLRMDQITVAVGARITFVDAVPDAAVRMHEITFEELRTGMPVALSFETREDGRLIVRSILTAKIKTREERIP